MKTKEKYALIGQIFGHLEVISYDKDAQKYLCKCDCGNEKLVRGSNLTNGRTQSCGHLRNKDITGEKFGKLTAIKKIGLETRGGSKKAMWLFECECGNTCEKFADVVKSGLVSSCGCANVGRPNKIE